MKLRLGLVLLVLGCASLFANTTLFLYAKQSGVKMSFLNDTTATVTHVQNQFKTFDFEIDLIGIGQARRSFSNYMDTITLNRVSMDHVEKKSDTLKATIFIDSVPYSIANCADFYPFNICDTVVRFSSYENERKWVKLLSKSMLSEDLITDQFSFNLSANPLNQRLTIRYGAYALRWNKHWVLQSDYGTSTLKIQNGTAYFSANWILTFCSFLFDGGKYPRFAGIILLPQQFSNLHLVGNLSERFTISSGLTTDVYLFRQQKVDMLLCGDVRLAVNKRKNIMLQLGVRQPLIGPEYQPYLSAGVGVNMK